MKLLVTAVAALVLSAAPAAAGPYFRLMDPEKINRSVGAYVAPDDPGQTSFTSAIALVTHSTRDGCLLPSIVCEDWSPLAVGLSYNAGRYQLGFGPTGNVAPIAKALMLKGLEAATKDDAWLGLKKVLGPSDPEAKGPKIAIGPAMVVAPVQNGVVIPLNEWRGRFRIFAGAAWAF